MLTGFTTNFFLIAISWSIINSIWQGLLIWILYKTVTLQKISSVFKYNFGLACIFILFLSFIYNLISSWILLRNPVNTSISVGFWDVTGDNLFLNFPLFFQWMALIYLSTCLIKSVFLIRDIFNIAGLKNDPRQKAPLDYRLFAQQVCYHLGIDKKLEMWMSKKVETPCVMGFFKPVILLPFTLFNHLSPSQAEAIIIHELAHIKRNDYIINILQSFIDQILFFNPFAILLSSAIRKERENCCDDWVISYQYDKHLYADALVTLERNRQQRLLLLPAAIGGKSLLLQRVKRLFGESARVEINRLEKLKLFSISVVVCFIILLSLPSIKKQTETASSITKDKIQPLLKTTGSGDYNWSPEGINAVRLSNTVSPKLPSTQQNTKNRISKSPRQNIYTGGDKDKNTYTVALVNNELLEQQETAKAVNASLSIDTVNTEIGNNNYIIKVEMTQSGSSATNAYLFEYNKGRDGKIEVKPLLLLSKKQNRNAGKNNISKFADSLPTRSTGKKITL